MTSKPGDLEAVRTIVATLEKFEPNEQERILRGSHGIQLGDGDAELFWEIAKSISRQVLK